MEKKFLGLGLTTLVGIWLLFCIFTVLAKTAFTKWYVKGVSEFFQAQ